MLEKWKQLFRKKPAQVTARVNPRSGLNAETVTNAPANTEHVATLFMQILLDSTDAQVAELSVPEKLVSQSVEQQLRDYEQRAAAVPRLPTVIPLLLKQLRDPLASAREYTAVITQDPVVSMAVLKVANSVYFNPYRKPLDNFERVVNDLGVLKLRMILSTAVMQPVLLDRHSALPQKIWNHSLACAVCCQQLADREGVDSFKAYMCGLVHDIGVVTLFNEAQMSSRQYLETPKLNPALLRQLFDRCGKPLAHWIAQDWSLPADIVRALAAQSEPGEGSPLAQILRRSNQLCEAFAVYRAGQLERVDIEQLAAKLKFPETIVDTLDNGLNENTES